MNSKINIVIIHCHTSNRGDEAAVHSMIDEIMLLYPDASITIFMRGKDVYPNLPINVNICRQYIPAGGKKKLIEYLLIKYSRGKIVLSKNGKVFINAVKRADIILHAPGGPSIGDTYYAGEIQYLRTYDIIRMMHKKYMFYAPSMGPFEIIKRNKWRERIISGASAVVLRDPISAEYVKKIAPLKHIYQTIDSALQHDIDLDMNEKKFYEYQDLKSFSEKHEKCIGITITDLEWHPLWGKKKELRDNIIYIFNQFVRKYTAKGYGIIFIPQLYGELDDYAMMNSLGKNNPDCYTIRSDDTRYDTYFQQYVIGNLYAVVGMRYHSNIFSAKMGTPFVSISYEEKMKGFMQKLGLEQYCIDVENLTFDELVSKFDLLINEYDKFKELLVNEHDFMKKESYRTTQILIDIIDEIENDRNNRKN